MAFVHGKTTIVLWDEYDLSAYFTTANSARELDAPETTTFGTAFKTRIAGHKDGTISLEGLFDPAAGASDVVLAAALSASASPIVTIGRESMDAVGDRAELLYGFETTYEITEEVEEAIGVSAEVTGNGGLDGGVVLHALEAETGDGNETSVDNAAATANGGVAHLHATAYSGLDSAVIKIQHSTDNFSGDSADLVTFTTLTAAGKERVVVAAGTTVRRYLRVNVDVTGTGSITFAVAFARR